MGPVEIMGLTRLKDCKTEKSLLQRASLRLGRWRLLKFKETSVGIITQSSTVSKGSLSQASHSDTVDLGCVPFLA